MYIIHILPPDVNFVAYVEKVSKRWASMVPDDDDEASTDGGGPVTVSASQSLKSEVEHAAGRRLGVPSAEVLAGHASVLPPWLRLHTSKTVSQTVR